MKHFFLNMIYVHDICCWSREVYKDLGVEKFVGIEGDKIVDVLLIQLTVTVILYYYNHLAH